MHMERYIIQDTHMSSVFTWDKVPVNAEKSNSWHKPTKGINNNSQIRETSTSYKIDLQSASLHKA